MADETRGPGLPRRPGALRVTRVAPSKPSLPRRAADAVRAATGFVSREIAQARRAICETCPNRVVDGRTPWARCAKANCACSIHGLASRADFTCPAQPPRW
jgi:hypothetical protein